MRVWDVSHVMSSNGWIHHFGDLKEAASMTFESRHQSKDGQVYPVEITNTYLEYDGKVYIFAQVKDICDRQTGRGSPEADPIFRGPRR